MTKVDERAFVPEVDDAARRRLAAALDREGVVSALLFGLQATGEVQVVVLNDTRRCCATASGGTASASSTVIPRRG